MKEITLSIFVLTIFFSCTSDSINDSTYDIETFDAIVEGEAMKADGSPLEHTYILVKSYNSPCGEKGEGVSHGTVTPSAGG